MYKYQAVVIQIASVLCVCIAAFLKQRCIRVWHDRMHPGVRWRHACVPSVLLKANATAHCCNSKQRPTLNELRIAMHPIALKQNLCTVYQQATSAGMLTNNAMMHQH
jgi:hypothetical protein